MRFLLVFLFALPAYGQTAPLKCYDFNLGSWTPADSTTLVFSDGETTWMTDGWFSRPGPLRIAMGKIEPDLSSMAAVLERRFSS